MLTLQERKDKQNKVDKNMSGLKDNATTDLDLNSPKKENISDASIHQIQTDISPDFKGKPVGVKFSKDINMWNLRQKKQESSEQTIDCQTVINMLDQIRHQYESMFQSFKSQRIKKLAQIESETLATQLLREGTTRGLVSTTDGSNFDIIKSDQMSHNGYTYDHLND